MNYGYFDSTDIEVFPCADGEGVTRELPLGGFFVSLTIADSEGIWLVWNHYLVPDILTTPGQVVDVAPLVFEFFDEPEPQLRAIAAGAEAFFPQPAAPDSQFPASTLGSATPPLGSCCAGGGDWVCEPDAGVWSGSWQDLAFSVPERGRWMYSFESTGMGDTASFVATAFTDRDCDVLYSRYELHGQVDATGMVVVDDEILKVVVNE